MNGCHSEKGKDNNSDTEPNPLVTITDMGTKVDDYVAAIKELLSSSSALPDAFDYRKIAVKIEEVEAILKHQKQRLSSSVERYGMCNPQLKKTLADHNRVLTSLEVKLAQLKIHLNAMDPMSIASRAQEVAESVRAQISFALDFAYS